MLGVACLLRVSFILSIILPNHKSAVSEVATQAKRDSLER